MVDARAAHGYKLLAKSLESTSKMSRLCLDMCQICISSGPRGVLGHGELTPRPFGGFNPEIYVSLSRIWLMVSCVVAVTGLARQGVIFQTRSAVIELSSSLLHHRFYFPDYCSSSGTIWAKVADHCTKAHVHVLTRSCLDIFKFPSKICRLQIFCINTQTEELLLLYHRAQI